MKTRKTSSGKVLRSLTTIILTGLLTTQFLTAQGWYDANWQYRSKVTITNPGSTELSNFQVQVILSTSNFDFTKALSDGRDIRVTSDNGTTLIPFWIESWKDDAPDPRQDTIWVKVPVIPTTGTIVYVYYGNASPTVPSSDPVETPPVGPYTRATNNPIDPTLDPGNGANLLAENIVYDSSTGRYWMVFANYRSGSYGVGLVWSLNPTDPASWNWHGNIYTSGSSGSFAPHILYENGLWYVFFAIRPDIVYITCSTINGTYSAPTTILSPSETWETSRVDEPYVFKRNDGTWILTYMGDAGSATEQVGYASSANLTGPYTKFSGNPCIAFGPSGSYDAGTVADPWVVEYHGVYYIGYTVSSTNSSPWSTACATTTDWQTFTKLGVIFPVASSGWDSNNSFRGAVTRINNEYVFSYTGDNFQMGIATQPIYVTPPVIINNPDAVFDFYDGFSGTSLDLTKWGTVNGTIGQVTFVNGELILTGSGSWIRIDGKTQFGMNYIGETRARHPNQGTVNMIGEVGFVEGNWNTVRILDDYPSTTNWQRQAKLTDQADVFVNMQQTSDKSWHIFRLYRQSPGTAGFQIDNNTVETVGANVPTGNLAPFLMSFGNTNQFIVDWTRVRKWAVSAPTPTEVSEESLITQWTGSVSSDWGATGNWTSGVPAEWSMVTIQDAINDPKITTDIVTCNNLVIDPLATLTIETGGTLTVSGSLTINSSDTQTNGSLVNLGTVSGTVIYNRHLLTKAGGGDFQLTSSPVVNNTSDNIDDIMRAKEWDEVAGGWITGSMTLLTSGRGYNLKQTDLSDGIVTFTGSLITDDIEIDATSPYLDAWDGLEPYTSRDYVQSTSGSHSGVVTRSYDNYGGGGWNLLGNPFASAMNVSAFIDANYSTILTDTQFDPSYVALYLYDGASSLYKYVAKTTGWEGEYLDEANIQVGQGFFVLAMNDLSTFTFTRSTMQIHDAAVPMLKSAEADNRWPGLQLKVKYGDKENSTLIVYNENMTAGLDAGYDVGQLSNNPDVEVYTSLVSKDNSVNFARQALPVFGVEKIIVPVGIDTKKGGEVTFSALVKPLENYKFWLEDRTKGIFTDLNNSTYTVTLPAETYGTGRFFIIASTNTPTGIEKPQAEDTGVRVWISNGKVIIKGDVSDRAICEIYDMRGQRILETRLADGELNTVTLPSGLNGVYLVRIKDGVKVTTSKAAIL